eukprot:537154_1
MAQQYTTTNQDENAVEMTGPMDIENNNTDGDTRENNTLLHEENDKDSACSCYKRWNNMQFILFTVLVVVFAIIIGAIFSNIDRMVKKDNDSKSTKSIKDYCEFGVYSPPENVTQPTPPEGWVFSYDPRDIFRGPGLWHNYFPQCGCNSHQSPRDINTLYSTINTPKQLCHDNNSLLQWKIDQNYTIAFNGTFEVFHNEHTIQMKNINYLNDSLVPIAMLNNLWQPVNSTLHSQFRLEQIHFHWGNKENGSPHTLNGRHYPLTIHFVHYSSDYNSLGEAWVDWMRLHNENKDRYILAVIGIFFEIDETNQNYNIAFDQLLSSEVLNSSNSEKGFVEKIDLNAFLPHDKQSYYYYPGSLTTPPCSPIVRWHLLSNPLKVNRNQIEKFRSIANETVTYNSRPIQINTNPVYACHSQFF